MWLKLCGTVLHVWLFVSEHGSSLFTDFLSCIARRVKLQGFEKYRGGLDCKSKCKGQGHTDIKHNVHRSKSSPRLFDVKKIKVKALMEYWCSGQDNIDMIKSRGLRSP